MTKKRFTYEYDDDDLYNLGFFLDNNKEMLKDDVLNTLNNLNEENEQLKKRISDYADITAITTHILNEEKEIAEEGIVLNVNRFHEVVNENEQLKTKNNAYIQDIEVFKEENTHLKLENEWLKSISFANNVLKENKQLKQIVDFYKSFQKDARELEKENELLKD